MSTAKNGDTVLVHYRGQLKDGSVFDQSSKDDPLQFTIGSGSLIPDFENAVLGMKGGESKTINVEAERAYGSLREDLIISVEREQFPDHIKPEIGLKLQITQTNGQPVVVTVCEVSTDVVKLDANHPLAGKDLIFDIQLVDIISA